jgi:hypothetical protein
MLDTRHLIISLPEDKYKAWDDSVNNIIASAACARNNLETLVGQLNHAAHIIPMACHFMSRIHQLMQNATQGKRWLHVPTAVANDLQLWKSLLSKAHTGIPMNLIVSWQPSCLCWSDSCPFGIGGYSLVTGFA